MFGTILWALQNKDWYFALHRSWFYAGRPISLTIGTNYIFMMVLGGWSERLRSGTKLLPGGAWLQFYWHRDRLRWRQAIDAFFIEEWRFLIIFRRIWLLYVRLGPLGISQLCSSGSLPVDRVWLYGSMNWLLNDIMENKTGNLSRGYRYRPANDEGSKYRKGGWEVESKKRPILGRLEWFNWISGEISGIIHLSAQSYKYNSVANSRTSQH